MGETSLECSSTVWNLLHDMAKLSRLLGVIAVAVVAPSCGVFFDASFSFFPIFCSFCCFDSAFLTKTGVGGAASLLILGAEKPSIPFFG